MQIAIPEKIKVGGLIYDVKVVDDLENENACATTSFKKLEITIEKGNPQYMQQVFIHEVLHAMNGEWNDERIEFLAMSLYQFFMDNPTIFKNGKK